MNKDNKSKKKYSVLVSISNKKYLPDPEGETILKDLILKGGFNEVEAVRCSKTINMLVRSRTEGQARKMVLKICAELRLYNPVVSKCDVTVTQSSTKN
ncbi:MAG TPA: phosphoribosylformylglycinamidine synthase subunit PurS [Nitrososphaeraceae archaeon]|jgi:phosphoribosylformylglycinamidine synthase subunit PurS|nr:phosphoribosylformylglycinamidine synthase subunit PurS [Nitrososphaeraceae archaeon]